MLNLQNLKTVDSSVLVISFSPVDYKGSLMLIQSDDWDRDYSPWKAPNPFGGEFEGCADQSLRDLAVIVEPYKDKFDSVVGIGYSLSGLFCLYGATRLDIFDKVGCVSSSLWYPGFVEYLKNNSLCPRTRDVYLSLGDKEANSKKAVLATVYNRTLETEQLLKDKGINVSFHLNPGGHFVNPDQRLGSALENLC